MLDSVERWNWAVRISVVGLFVVALVGIAFRMASVVVPVVLAWVVAMVLLPVVDGLERRGVVACAHIDCPSHPPDREHNGDSRGPHRSTDLLGRAGEGTRGAPQGTPAEAGKSARVLRRDRQGALASDRRRQECERRQSFLFQYCNCDPPRADARGQHTSVFS